MSTRAAPESSDSELDEDIFASGDISNGTAAARDDDDHDHDDDDAVAVARAGSNSSSSSGGSGTRYATRHSGMVARWHGGMVGGMQSFGCVLLCTKHSAT